MADAAALLLDEVSKSYGVRRPVSAVRDVSFTIAPGEIVGLLGPNGAGKTTVIKCALGLVRRSSGRALVFGRDAEREPKAVLATAAAVLEGSRNVYWHLTPWENATFYSALQGHWAGNGLHRAYLEDLFERFGLSEHRNTPVRQLSTGYKQKTAVISALARRTPLVFLDEPTLGLDVSTSLELRGLLRQLAANEGLTVILSSHDMDVVEDICQRVIILSGGRVIADDQVARLLDLFRARRYRLEITGEVCREVREAVANLDAAASWTAAEKHTGLEVGLTRAAELYDLVDILRRAGLLIEHIAQLQPNLEQAFLGLVREACRERGTP